MLPTALRSQGRIYNKSRIYNLESASRKLLDNLSSYENTSDKNGVMKEADKGGAVINMGTEYYRNIKQKYYQMNHKTNSLTVTERYLTYIQ